MKKVFVVSICVLAVFAACGKKNAEKSKKDMCVSMYEARQEMPIFKDEDGSKKDLYIKECLTMPDAYVKCDSEDSSSDECIELMKKHQDDLNTVLVTGKSLKEILDGK